MILHGLAVLFLAQQDDMRRQMEESIARQKAAIRKQVKSAGFFTPTWFTPLPSLSDCDALPEAETASLIAAAATKHGVDPIVLRAVAKQESAFKPCAVSSKGAMGLMQLMPATAERFKVDDPFDAAQSLDAGARYLKELTERFKGDLKLVLAAYNAGPERIDGKVPEIAETQDYVAQILRAVEEGRKQK